jgi:asparagine N-glycosylation enzyme membrane subunit Stt3
MGNRLWIIAAILIIAWGIGLIGFGMSGFVHILLGLACVAIILRLEEPIFRSTP